MAKWKLFGKPKEKEEEKIQEDKVEESQGTDEDKPLAEYNETIYSTGSSKKKKEPVNSSSDQRVWRDVDSIEKKVDNIDLNVISDQLKAYDVKLAESDKKIDGNGS